MEEVYNILSNVDKLSIYEYQHLMLIYGEGLVNQVINNLILEDDKNILKFERCFSSLTGDLGDMSNMNGRDIYLASVREMVCFDSDKNTELMHDAYKLIKQMEIIFQDLNCDDLILGKNQVPWIADKVNYCLDNCSDISILNKLNCLYNDYCKIRNMIVSGNLRLVIMIALRYSAEEDVIDDLIQEGNKGLIRAIEKFDINKNVTFTTYAYFWILQNMSRGIKTIRYPMRLPINKIYENSMIMDVRNDLCLKLGRNVTNIELSNFLNISVNKIDEMLFYFNKPVFLDEMVESDFEDKEIPLKELIVDNKIDVFSDAVSEEYREQLLKFLSSFLKQKEYEIISLYFGFNKDGECLSELQIAKLLGITQQRVGQIKKKTLQKLRGKPSIRDIIFV